jgi:ABC-type multidrug transport system ATPase subunit
MTDTIYSHRLSTITTADQILVLHQGAVAESGTHVELLAKKGRYAAMWKKQIRAEEAAREAQILSDKATKLREQSLKRPDSRGGTSEDSSDGETEHGPKDPPSPYTVSGGIAGRTIGRAAESLRGAASLLRGQVNGDKDNGSTLPAGHP